MHMPCRGKMPEKLEKVVQAVQDSLPESSHGHQDQSQPEAVATSPLQQAEAAPTTTPELQVSQSHVGLTSLASQSQASQPSTSSFRRETFPFSKAYNEEFQVAARTPGMLILSHLLLAFMLLH